MKKIKHNQRVCPNWFRFLRNLSDHSSYEHNRLLTALKCSEYGFPSVMKLISHQITKKQTSWKRSQLVLIY